MPGRDRVSSVLLGPGGEFDLIRRFMAEGARDTAMPPEVLVGPGDDAAVLEGGWVLSTDLSVQDVHYRRAWLSDREIGWRAAAAALSDLAAMAARPVGVLLSLAIPREGVDAAEVHGGARAAAASVGAVVLGGDVTASGGPLVVDVVVIGRTDTPILRSGARVGDQVWVSGTLGASAAAVHAWDHGVEPAADARRAFAHPMPRVEVALALSENGAACAMVDLSDGLAGDAGHLAAASGVAIVIESAAVPVAAAAAALGAEAALEAALHGGEDYELCFAAAPGSFDAAELSERLGVALTRVGRVEAGEGVHLEGSDGRRRPVGRGGFDHLPEGTP